MGQPGDNRADYLFKLLLCLISTVLVAVGLMWFAGQFYNIVILLSLSVIFAYILLMPVEWAERGVVFLSKKAHQNEGFHRFASQTLELQPRIAAVITVFFTVFLLLSFSAVSLLPVLSRQVEGFGRALPHYVSQAEGAFLEWSDDTLGSGALRTIFDPEIAQAQKEGVVQSPSRDDAPITEAERQVIRESFLKSTVTQAGKILEHATSSALENLVGLVTHTISSLIYFLTGLVLLFYFLLDGHKLRSGLLCMLPVQMQHPAEYFLDSFHTVMLNFVKGQFLLAVISGTLMFILYSLFHVKYAIFLSAFFTVAEILPVIGPWLAFTPGILVMLFSDHPETAFYVWILYVLIKDNFLLPKVVGDVMGLHPVVVIFSLFIFARLGGVMGVVMALPLASMVNIVVRYLMNPPQLADQEVADAVNS